MFSPHPPLLVLKKDTREKDIPIHTNPLLLRATTWKRQHYQLHSWRILETMRSNGYRTTSNRWENSSLRQKRVQVIWLSPPLRLISCIHSELVSTQDIPLGGSSGEHCPPHRGPDLSNQSRISSANKAPDHTGNSDGPGMVGGDISGSCKVPCSQPENGSMGMIGNGSVGPSEILIQQITRSTLRTVGMGGDVNGAVPPSFYGTHHPASAGELPASVENVHHDLPLQ